MSEETSVPPVESPAKKPLDQGIAEILKPMMEADFAQDKQWRDEMLAKLDKLGEGLDVCYKLLYWLYQHQAKKDGKITVIKRGGGP